MTITNEAGILSGMMLPTTSFFKRAAGSISNGGPVALGLIGTGYPSAFVPGTPGLGGATVDGTTSTLGGTFPFINPSSGETDLAKVQLLCNGTTLYVGIFDLLWYNTGITVTTTTAQTLSGITIPSRDATGTTNGAGVIPWLYCSVATTNASAITGTTISYTDQGGNAGNTATIGLAGWPATAVAGTFIPFALAAGDYGVQSIQTLTLATSYVTGTINLVLARQVASIAVPTISSGWLADWSYLGFPQLYNGTALSFYVIQSGTNTTTISGLINMAQG